MRRPSSGVAAPSKESVEKVARAQARLRAFPASPPGSPEAFPPEVLAGCEQALTDLREELERLVPWFNEFVGSSLVVSVARTQVDETLEELVLHAHTMREPASLVVPLLVRPVHVTADHLDPVLSVLPGHIHLAGRLDERRQPLGVRIAAMPHRLRVRYYLGIVLGVFLLLSVAGVLIVLLDPAVSAAIGVSKLLDHYAASDAGFVVAFLLLLSGVRLLLGSIWLSRSIRILPAYEEKRVDEAREGLRQQEDQALERLSPTAPVTESEPGADVIFPPRVPPSAPSR